MTELKVGALAPDFELPTDGGGTLKLSELRGNNVVLYFYPKDDTPGCTIEAKDFRDFEKEFKITSTIVVGLSKDSVKSHDKFKEKHCLPFLLVSDEENKVVAAYGSWVKKSMYGKEYMGIQRDTFLIDAAGRIAQIWRKVSVDGHAKDVLAAANRLKKHGA